MRLVNVEEAGSCGSLRDDLESCLYSLEDGEAMLSHHIFVLFPHPTPLFFGVRDSLPILPTIALLLHFLLSPVSRPPNPALRRSPLFTITRRSARGHAHCHAPGDARRLVRGDSRGRGHYPACPAARWRPEGSGQRQKVCCGIVVVGPGG